jgi:hypothetical protein
MSRYLKVLILGIAAGFFFYAIRRAVRLSVTFDEAATYITYLSSNFFSVFDFRAANNHFLSSLVARAFCFRGVPSEFVLRLPSLLGFGFYLFFSFKAMRRFFNGFIALAGFLLLNLNPYLLEFFSLGRGYGLAVGLEMGAIYFFLVFVDSTRQNDAACRALRWAFLFAIAAALANFAFLNIGLSLVIYAFFLFVIFNLKSRATRLVPRPSERTLPSKSRLLMSLAILALPFNLVVIGQKIRLSEEHIDPVSVRIQGLEESEKRRVAVSAIDFYGNEFALLYEDGAWRPEKIFYLKRLKLGFPGLLLDKVGGLEIEIGPGKLYFSPGDLKKWKHFSAGNYQFYYSDPSIGRKNSLFSDMRDVMNWRGDDAFLWAFAGEAGGALVFYALSVGLIFGLGRLLVKWGLLEKIQFRALFDSACLAIIYISYPIYVVSHHDHSIYGGLDGFIRDTFYSLIGSSFYEIRYGARQETLVFRFMLTCIAIYLLLAAWSLRKKNFQKRLPGLSGLGLIFIASLLVILQKAFFQIPHVMGRTALFFVPLLVLFLLFLFHGLAEINIAGRAAALIILTALVGLSSYHFARSANMMYTLDWKFDADTRAMVEDLASLKALDLDKKSNVRLGVDWHFWPCSKYYQRKQHLSWLEIIMVPSLLPCDYYYLSKDDGLLRSLSTIKIYPVSGTVLGKKTS